MNAPFIFTLNVGNGIGSTGQVNTVYGASSSIAKAKAKADELRDTGVICHCLVNA
jgi:hypothetical protein